ncbi:MAG: TIGR01777 family oxidoreductase [Methylomonas sp.]|nr:TIGR01777 family oxidoreductase [Methylomonas sp.]PPD21121.1 MAG: TIGR01777 family protein [Methylomonas sp.]PPD27555.1 MAG: TIGR01777 family protein [Methylomonas sp.]PPD39551.1 MAG: TIGR01777 family protein [Methylomonas sp.]PPD55802.1 MAG: TIGR01777 family protein [Methylomonas sp.]
MTSTHILITGGTGFLGGALAHRLVKNHHRVSVFSRDADKVARAFGESAQAYTSVDALPDAGGFSAIVNLAGAPMFDQRWSAQRKAVLRDSRIELTRRLVDWMDTSHDKPEVFISGSAIGIYGNQGDTLLDEASPANTDFAQQLCADWEQAARAAEALGVRVCRVRTGLVLGMNGGLLQRMLLPFRFGLGGRLGQGDQWMSWIHLIDWLRAVDTLIRDTRMNGAYNLTAPNPVRNAEFSATLARVLHRPQLLPLPEALLKPLLGEMAALVLGSQRVMPQRLLDAGFEFQQPQLEAALRQLLQAHQESGHADR